MKKLLIVAAVLMLAIGMLLAMSFVRQGNDRRALAAYKAQLRGQGEWLSLEDAGYPFELEANADLAMFTELAKQLAATSGIPAALNPMPFAGPGLLIVAWRQEVPATIPGSRASPTPVTWQELESDLKDVAPALAGLRAELEHPPRRFRWDYPQPYLGGGSGPPFVQMRNAAQFLVADTLVALRADDLGRTREDLHALTQMTHLLRDDFTLVTAMIRVAVAGLGLSVTAQALLHEGWDEDELAALQRDWEAVDIMGAVESGFVGERLFGLQTLHWVRQPAPSNRLDTLLVGTTTVTGVKDRLLERAGSLYWRGHMDQDELFYIQYHQATLDILRDLRARRNWATLEDRMQMQRNLYDQTIASPLGRYQYRFSAIAIANATRAVQTALRHEVLRRMTITAIALQRFHLRHGHFPRNLHMLVPDFLDEVPTDPWTGEALIYRLNYTGTITLYSVGEDDVDDGGDCTPAAAPRQIDFWTGKDVVWPRASLTTGEEQE